MKSMPRRIVFFLSLTVLAAACSIEGNNGEDQPEPYFQSGEYGGDPLPSTEDLYNLKLSPDGGSVALVRRSTPDNVIDPTKQLWVVNRDGSNPELIGVNINTVDWSPDGTRLAVSVSTGIESYVYTIDLDTRVAVQWSGQENAFFSKPTVGLPIWFQDGKRLLVSVRAKAYQQPFERGIYTIDTESGEIKGPLVELMQAAYLGDNDNYVVGKKYTYNHDPRDGNYITYSFLSGTWNWITSFPSDSLNYVDATVPSPTSDLVVQGRRVENAEQLFLMDRAGKNVRQITIRGGNAGRWTYDGKQILFRRDVHKGSGARYVPFVYDLAIEQAVPLWPNLPDSLPESPDLSSQTLASMTRTP